MATGVSKVKWTQYNAEGLPPKSNLAAAELIYPGKKNATDILGTEPAKVKPIWPPTDHRKHTNRLYFADNLGVLSLLLNDAEVVGKVRLVYIDPPYSTNSVFQSRKQAHAYSDLLTGTAYLEFMRERLILLRELLADDGSIYVHLDQKMAFHVKVLMDEIFSPRNFKNWITRKKCHSKNFTRKAYGDVTDYLLFYTKSDNYVWNRPSETWTTEKVAKEYPYIDEKTGKRYKKVPIHAPGTRNGETGKPWHGMCPPPGKHWQYTPHALDLLDANGEIYWSPSGNPRRKIIFDENKGFMVPDLWLEFPDAHNQNIYITGYPTEKNPALVERLITASSNCGDLVLDCFSGSGTTLDVASQLKRNWIGVDNSYEAIATTIRRFAHGLERMGDYVKKENRRDNAKADGQLDFFVKEMETEYGAERAVYKFVLYSDEEHLEHLTSLLKELIHIK